MLSVQGRSWRSAALARARVSPGSCRAAASPANSAAAAWARGGFDRWQCGRVAAPPQRGRALRAAAFIQPYGCARAWQAATQKVLGARSVPRARRAGGARRAAGAHTPRGRLRRIRSRRACGAAAYGHTQARARSRRKRGGGAGTGGRRAPLLSPLDRRAFLLLFAGACFGLLPGISKKRRALVCMYQYTSTRGAAASSTQNGPRASARSRRRGPGGAAWRGFSNGRGAWPRARVAGGQGAKQLVGWWRFGLGGGALRRCAKKGERAQARGAWRCWDEAAAQGACPAPAGAPRQWRGRGGMAAPAGAAGGQVLWQRRRRQSEKRGPGAAESAPGRR